MEEKVSQRKHALTVDQILQVMEAEANDYKANRDIAIERQDIMEYTRLDTAIKTLDSYIEWIEDNDY